MKTLVVVPTRREAHAIGGGPFVVGAGEESRRVLAARLAHDRPGRVLIAGFCGGLDPSIPSGGAIFARRVVAAGEPEILPDAAVFDAIRKELRGTGLAFVSSTLLTVPRPVVTASEKRDLWNEHGAAGADMETYHLAVAATDCGVPWLAVRVVLDPAKHSLPGGLATWRRESDDRMVARAALGRPWDWPGYLRLAIASRKTRGPLRRSARTIASAAERSQVVESLPMA